MITGKCREFGVYLGAYWVYLLFSRGVGRSLVVRSKGWGDLGVVRGGLVREIRYLGGEGRAGGCNELR